MRFDMEIGKEILKFQNKIQKSNIGTKTDFNTGILIKRPTLTFTYVTNWSFYPFLQADANFVVILCKSGS